MHEIEQLTESVRHNQDLNHEQAASAARLLAAPDIGANVKEAFLLALAEKGESAVEVAAFAEVFRGLALNPAVERWASEAIDVCGTGGDGSSTFNVSTAVSFLVAAAGVPVFKHGNRSITSDCGSADLMEALGIRLDAPHELLRESLETLNFCFFFAPAFHPAFKEIMPVRKALAAKGQRSIFNLLGPLINPGRPAHQLLGVFAGHWVTPLAEALGALGLSAGLVVHGTPVPGQALDELSCAGTNQLAGFGRLSDRSGALDLAEAGLEACEFSELKGGGVEANVATLHALFAGEDSVPAGLRDTVLLNAGAALWVAGVAQDLQVGVEQVRQIIGSGRATQWLEEVRAFYRQH